MSRDKRLPLVFPHVRMAAILLPADHEVWLDASGQDVERLQSLLRRWASEGIEAYPVGTRVNKPANDTPASIAAVA